MQVKNRMQSFFGRHWSFIVTDPIVALTFLSVVFSLALYGSFNRQDWQLIGRGGNLMILAGVLMSLRRVLRLRDEANNEKMQPWTLPVESNTRARQLNFGRINQEVFAIGDTRIQLTGFIVIVVGTLVASYGDLLLDWLLPF
jgi:hypothetical protein